jgi:lipopolysaccharide heptosyltransferase II
LLVVLPNWYGETLFATPFLRRLRQQHPGAFVATLGRPQAGEVLAHNPDVDVHLAYDELGTQRGPRGAWGIVRAVRAQRFDTAFILRRSLTRTGLLAAAGVPVRIGFANLKSGWLLTRRVAPPPGPVHKALAYLPLLEDSGPAAAAARCTYVVSDDERQEARRRLQALGLPEGRPLIVLHPGANWPHKRWPIERFGELGRRLAQEQQARVLITGAPEDVPLAQQLAPALKGAAAVLAGRTSFRQLGACLEHADLLISNDTGVLHVAGALGRPLVALYGPTSPALTGPLSDPSRTAILHHPDGCPAVPCYRPDRPPHPGMSAISVEEVHAAARRLLGRAARPAEPLHPAGP